jgi:hypothetical protein
MRMSQKYEINRALIESERNRIFFVKLTAALKHSAIDKNAMVTDRQKVARPCYVLRRTVK